MCAGLRAILWANQRHGWGRWQMPRRLVAQGARRAAFAEYEDPALGLDQVRVRVEYASPKHGTELAVFRGEDPFTTDLYDEDWHLFVKRDLTRRGPGENGEPVLGNQWIGVI